MNIDPIVVPDEFEFIEYRSDGLPPIIVTAENIAVITILSEDGVIILYDYRGGEFVWVRPVDFPTNMEVKKSFCRSDKEFDHWLKLAYIDQVMK